MNARPLRVWLVDDDASPFDHHEGVRGAKVDRNVVREKAKQAVEWIGKRQGRKPAVVKATRVAAGSLPSICAITPGGESRRLCGWRLDSTFS